MKPFMEVLQHFHLEVNESRMSESLTTVHSDWVYTVTNPGRTTKAKLTYWPYYHFIACSQSIHAPQCKLWYHSIIGHLLALLYICNDTAWTTSIGHSQKYQQSTLSHVAMLLHADNVIYTCSPCYQLIRWCNHDLYNTHVHSHCSGLTLLH